MPAVGSFGAKIFRGHLKKSGNKVIADGVTLGDRNVGEEGRVRMTRA